MTKHLLRLFASLPLRLIHLLGALLGWLVYLASPRYAARLRENFSASGICVEAGACRTILHKAVSEAGKSVAELAVVWGRPLEKVVPLVRHCYGWEHVEAALAAKRGIIFLTPHLGCFEITALYYAARHPITVLYRPPKLAWVEPWMAQGRGKSRVTLAPTDMSGVKALLKTLKRGEAAGILPDQVPGEGEGVWADFFGKPAYTMTLAARLAQSTGAAIILAYAERLPRGEGYTLHLQPFPAAFPEDRLEAAQMLNHAIEDLVRKCPEQYLWSYNRYKVPAGATPPEAD